MTKVLVVHHTPSPALQTMLDAVVEGLGLADVEAVIRPALTCSPVDALEADGYIVGGPVNLGMLAGAVKHLFDQAYYPCLDATVGRPFGVYLHGNDDAAGALRDVGKIVTGLRWRKAHADVVVLGMPSKDDVEAAWNLGATVAANLTT